MKWEENGFELEILGADIKNFITCLKIRKSAGVYVIMNLSNVLGLSWKKTDESRKMRMETEGLTIKPWWLFSDKLEERIARQGVSRTVTEIIKELRKIFSSPFEE